MRVRLSVWTEVYDSFGQISGSVNPGSDGKNYVELWLNDQAASQVASLPHSHE